jgi:hypothetical protein
MVVKDIEETELSSNYARLYSQCTRLNMYCTTTNLPDFLRTVFIDYYTPHFVDLFIHHSASTILNFHELLRRLLLVKCTKFT